MFVTSHARLAENRARPTLGSFFFVSASQATSNCSHTLSVLQCSGGPHKSLAVSGRCAPFCFSTVYFHHLLSTCSEEFVQIKIPNPCKEIKCRPRIRLLGFVCDKHFSSPQSYYYKGPAYFITTRAFYDISY